VKRLVLVAVLCGAACASCDARQNVHEPEWTLSRMLEQPRYEPYGQSGFFDDGRAMRSPVEHTVSRESVLGSPLYIDGIQGGVYAQQIPLPVTVALLEEGRVEFDIVCAACHGVLGDGNSPVAAKMQLRKPPSLLADDIATLPAGRVYRIVTVGYGLMPAYDYQLTADQRWSVVAYVKALQRSQAAKVSELPEVLRAELQRQAP
jgi:mono/diheme cytochrome c family protein